jgi:sodium-dependent phosphate cotransporter
LESPIEALIKPAVAMFVSTDKAKIKAAAAGEAVQGSLLKGGVFQGTEMSDAVVGTFLLILAVAMTVISLLIIVKLMRTMLEARATKYLKRSLEFNPYASMAIGAGTTVMVQSSSITTSAMVPMVAVGLVSLEAVFPLTLGANIGTTVTALLASMGATGDGAALGLQIALCHFLFNILGIAVWFPIPAVRNVPLWMARKLGELVSKNRSVALVYIGVVFFGVPLAVLGLDKLIG